MFERPQSSEYDEYYGRYIDQVPQGDVRRLLETEIESTLELLGRVPAERETYRYAEGKWSLRDVVGHMIDTERVFAFRGLWIARGAPEALPGMEQDDWAELSNAHRRPLAELADDLAAARRGHVAMFDSFDDAAATRTGVASGCRFSLRAIAYILVGHEIHHRKVLRERYLE